MKANLLPSSLCFLSLFCALVFTAHPALVGAAAGQISAPKQDTPALTNASAASNIEVENWVKPEPGWLYVLDPEPAAGTPGGRVWLLDPETAKVMGSIRTGDNPDFALSPDGSHLYVASITEHDSSELAVIDTAVGVVQQRNTIVYRETANVLPSFSAMAVSGDGLALHVLIDSPQIDPAKPQDQDSFLLATFDSQSGEFLPRPVRVYNCGPGRFISQGTAGQFDFLCPRSNKIRLIRLDSDSRELQKTEIKFPWERRVGVAEAIEPPGGQGIAIIRGDGAVFQMNLDTQEFAETAAHGALPNRVPPAAWPSSPDGGRIYLGYNGDYQRSYDNRFYLDYGRAPNLRPNDATAREFHVLDTRTWRKLGTIKTSMPFWTAVTANDGKLLYATAPQKHSILVIDTVKMRQTRVLKLGGAPALALVAP
jgi:DNA-binding beta-propeller fold protein YncE